MSDVSGRRPLTGGSRMSPSAAKVHSIGSILTVVSCVFFAISFISSLTGVPGEVPTPAATTFNAKGISGHCNPFSYPGHIAHDPFPVWKTFDNVCPASTAMPDMLASLPNAVSRTPGLKSTLRSPSISKQREAQLMQAFKNRTVVLIGDGVDRTMIMNLCDMVGEKPVSVDAMHPWGASLKNQPLGRKDPGDTLLADYCYVPHYSAIFTSFYHYGADTNELWREQRDYLPPGQFEKRISQLLKPYLEAMATPLPYNVQMPLARSSKPDLVVFSSSLWDLAAWAMEDVSTYQTITTADLSDNRLQWWRSRSVDMIEELRQQLGPSVPLAWRSTHVPMTKVNDTVQWFFSSMHTKSSPAPDENGIQFAHPNRITQLNHARRATLAMSNQASVRGWLSKNVWSAGSMPLLRDIPFGEVTMGQSTTQDTLLNPGIETYAYMFWSMVLQELLNLSL